RVLYPTKPNSSVQKIPVVGGTPITTELATELRTLTFGSAALMGAAESEWLGQWFDFHDADTYQAYGLRAPRFGTRGFIMCVQGYVLKHLLFNRRGPRSHGGDPAEQLKVTIKSQEDSLVGAISDILWKAGDRQMAVLCLTQETSYINDSATYQTDGVTEKIHTFEFKKQDELTFWLKKYLFEFLGDETEGVLLLLYSIILSRGFEKLAEDMDGNNVTLIKKNGDIHPCLAALMLTGRATHYLHNGIIYEGGEDEMAKPKTGILTRGEIGFLVYQRRSEKGEFINVGSRLKTPALPVWIVLGSDSYGILFNPNRELTRDYHAENRFDLYYYNGHFHQTTATIITIDTRVQGAMEDYETPVLEVVIHTKWSGAEINWNETTPYI
ncbi:DUF4205, partial [Halocaridina rubra]